MARLILLALMVLGYPFSEYLAGHAWTYMFAHANLAHLALNAITLWSFGKPVERELGPAQTLALFMVAAIVGGVVQLLATPYVAIAGASAGIFGLIAAAIAHNPECRVGLPLLMFRGVSVLLLVVFVTLLCALFGWLPQVAHLAHFMGMLIGWCWVRR